MSADSAESEGRVATNGAAAIWYAEHLHWHVFPVHGVLEGRCTCGADPCSHAGKHPRTKHGFKDASRDPEVVRAWWKRWPDANVALACGDPSGVDVLDVDARHYGNETLWELERKHGELPATVTSLTGGGGSHVFFAHRAGLKNMVEGIGEGLDLKTTGGYVVLAPSMHISGRRYCWEGASRPNETPLAPLPEWLFRLATTSKVKGKEKGSAAAPIKDKIPHGRQHVILLSFGGSMRRRGAGEEEIYAALSAMNRLRCEKPGSEANIRNLAKSLCKYPPDAEANVFQADFPAGAPDAPGKDGSQSERQPDWCSKLIRAKEGTIKALLANAITALRLAPEWAGVLTFNEFAWRVIQDRPAPWTSATTAQWTDNEDRLTADWLQHHGVHVGVEVAGQAVQTVARDRQFHPVRAYLDSLQWDGQPRLTTWLTTYLGVEDTKYSAAVGLRWTRSAVARIYQPGAKVDCCLILEGPQGGKKSTALKTLAGDWFTDEIADLGSKDSALQTQGVWIIEIAELDSMTRAEVSRIKAFMSRATDRFRPPYGKQVIESPRQCVFAGSVNHWTYLRDETGGRRFWPARCGEIDVEALARDRDQLWAEAVSQYRRGEVWWLETRELIQEAEQQQSDRYEEDPWQGLIAGWILNPQERRGPSGEPFTEFTSYHQSVCVADILNHCIGKQQDQWTQGDQNRVARCLRALKWERFQQRKHNGGREWRYRGPE
jgi:predicted P-loop ATPase